MAHVIEQLRKQGVELPPMFTPQLIEEVASIIESSMKSGERTTGWERIQRILLANGIAKEKARFLCDRVGVHLKNRSKLGVGASESQCHGKDILTEGFSWKKASDATAIEKPPPPHDSELIKFNADLVEKSVGLIPALVILEILSVGGSHTNTFCRQVKSGVRAVVQSLADANGKLNREELCLGRPEFKDAVDEGLFWFVMHWAVAFVWPNLLTMIQMTLNTVSRGGQSETEMMLFMHDEAAAAIAQGSEPEWAGIIAAAKASMPACAPYMHVLAKFVQLNTGGELLQDLNICLKAFACSESGPLRALGGEYIGKVAALDWGKSEKYPHVQNACLMANLASPKVSDGICKLIVPSNLSVLMSKDNRAKVVEADRLMADARKLCDAMSVTPSIRIRAVGMLDTRCVTHILKKDKEAEGRTFDAIAEIAKVIFARVHHDHTWCCSVNIHIM